MEALEYLGQDAVRNSLAILIPGRTILETAVPLISQLTLHEQNYHEHRVEKRDCVTET